MLAPKAIKISNFFTILKISFLSEFLFVSTVYRLDISDILNKGQFSFKGTSFEAKL